MTRRSPHSWRTRRRVSCRKSGALSRGSAGCPKGLKRFSFPLVAAPLAGLLTRPENHCETGRIEALIHLAAVACWGNKKPRPRHLRKWLNRISDHPICRLGGPIEDVFVGNVGTLGNFRLFGGRWANNADQVQACVETLLGLRERPWAMQTLRHVMALLRVSEAVADRAGIPRNTRARDRRMETIAVTASAVAESRGHVRFSDDELVAVGVRCEDLDPFLFQGEHARLLAEQSIGHTALERRPLVRFGGRTTVGLPTGIGAAIRRFVIERATAAGGPAAVSIDLPLGAVHGGVSIGTARLGHRIRPDDRA